MRLAITSYPGGSIKSTLDKSSNALPAASRMRGFLCTGKTTRTSGKDRHQFPHPAENLLHRLAPLFPAGWVVKSITRSLAKVQVPKYRVLKDVVFPNRSQQCIDYRIAG